MHEEEKDPTGLEAIENAHDHPVYNDMVKRFLGDSKENEKKYHKMWDDHDSDSRYGGMNKKRKYDNMAYAGFEGMDGHSGEKNSNADWNDYHGYYGGHYGWGGMYGYGHGR